MRTTLPMCESRVCARAALAVAVAERDEQPAVAAKDQPRAEVMAAVDRHVLAEDHLHVGEAALGQAAARHGRAVAALARLGVLQ